MARYIARDSRRREKYFDTLSEARSWLADPWYEDKHNMVGVAAVNNDIMNGVRYMKPVRAVSDNY